MGNTYRLSRRTAIKSSVFGLLAVSIPNIIFSKEILGSAYEVTDPPEVFHRYPSIDDEIVAEMVGASHFNLDRVRELVTNRPELARATWDWAFGDWETALGAASHVGRRDIAAFLMHNGARPDIFTYAMLGEYVAVKAMIEATPGIESIFGPHGISLLQHAKAGLRSDTLTPAQKEGSERLVEYLEKNGKADPRVVDLKMTPEDKEKYLGDYMYGDAAHAGFSVKLNMRNMLSLGRLGEFGGGLFQKAPNLFTYNGISSVEIQFTVEGDSVVSLTVIEPELTLKAIKA